MKTGHLTIITGPMFSEKSAELIRVIRRAEYARKSILAYIPLREKRTEGVIATRRKNADGTSTVYDSFPAKPLESKAQLIAECKVRVPQLIIIDELHFFDPWICAALDEVRRMRWIHAIDIYASGLDLDHQGIPFETTAGCMAYADYIQKETAICFRCGEPAQMSQKLTKGTERFALDNLRVHSYEARCRKCFVRPSA